MGTGRKWVWRSCRGALPGHVTVCHWNMICRSQPKEHNTDLTDCLVYCTLHDSEYVLWRGWEWNEMKPGEMMSDDKKTQIASYCTHMAAMFFVLFYEWFVVQLKIWIFKILFSLFWFLFENTGQVTQIFWAQGRGDVKKMQYGTDGLSSVYSMKPRANQRDSFQMNEILWNNTGWLTNPPPPVWGVWSEHCCNDMQSIFGDKNAARNWFYTHVDVLDQ